MASKIWALFYLIVTLLVGTTQAVSSVPSLWNREVDMSNVTFRTAQSANTCEAYEKYWLNLHPEATLTITMLGVFFYSIEIWIRFLSCPNKRMFWKTLNAIDMIFSLLEVICYILYRAGALVFVPNADVIEGSDILCTCSKFAQYIIILIGQLRYFRLLTYASIYR